MWWYEATNGKPSWVISQVIPKEDKQERMQQVKHKSLMSPNEMELSSTSVRILVVA